MTLLIFYSKELTLVYSMKELISKTPGKICTVHTKLSSAAWNNIFPGYGRSGLKCTEKDVRKYTHQRGTGQSRQGRGEKSKSDSQECPRERKAVPRPSEMITATVSRMFLYESAYLFPCSFPRLTLDPLVLGSETHLSSFPQIPSPVIQKRDSV